MKRIAGIRFFLLLAAQLFVFNNWAQFYPVRQYTVEDGLAHSNVFRIFQDKKGFIWLGTEYGVSCFDGKKFTNYTSSEGLSFNTVMSVSESETGEKWVCTYGGGINIIKNDSVEPFIIKAGVVSKSIIYSLFDKQKAWIIDKSGDLYCYNRQQIMHIPVKDEKNRTVFIKKMIQGANGEILFSTNKGIYIAAGQTLTPFLHELINEPVYATQLGKDSTLWCALKNRIIGIKNNTIVNNIPIGDYNEVSDMLLDKNGAIWLAIPGEGILYVNRGVVKNITAYIRLQHILINDLFEDLEGNIWIATHGSGLFFIRSLNIINYPVELEKINNYTKVIKNINGNIYSGSVGTVSICGQDKFLPYPVSLLYSSDFIYFIEQQDDNLYIGTPRGMIIKHLKNKKERIIPLHGAISYYRDKNGRQWIGGYGTLGYLQNDSFRYITHPAINNRRVNDITPTGGGNILFATDSGLVRYDGKTFLLSNTSINTWSNSINDIFIGRNEAIWLATDWGVCCIKGNRQQWYYKKDGLSHNKCNAITADEAGNIWLGTIGGLDKFNGAYFRTFTHKSGLTSNEVLSLTLDADGSLWVGTVNGISRILQKEAESAITVPQVYITNAHTPTKKYPFPREIIMQPGEKELRINFTAINFSYSDKTEFSYCILGQGNTWHTTSDNSLTISSLAPGTYDFIIKARIAGQPEDNKITTLHINVLAPFWLKTWFILLCVVVAVVLFYLIIKWFIVRNEKAKYEKASLQHKIAYLKQQALTALINPHFIFNCLNSIQSYIYKKNTTLANQYLIKFSRLIRMTLDRAEHTYITLDEEIARLDLYLALEHLRFGEKLKYAIVCNPAINPQQVEIPNMILQPYIENAIRHGIRHRNEGGTITIAFSSITKGLLQIIINDDGVGINKSNHDKKADGHRPLGMKLTGERLSLLSQLNKKTFEVNINEKIDERGNVCGTQVVISVAIDVEPDPVSLTAE